MNNQSTEEPTIKRSYWIAMLLLLCCAMVTDVNIQIVIAQEAAATASAPDEGVSPSPEVAVVVEPASAPADDASIKITAPAADETVPASEVTSQEELNAVPHASELIQDTKESIKDVVSSLTDAVRNLSVEPGSRPLLPVDRPSWVGSPVDLSTKNHMLSVGSSPMLHEREVDSALDEPLVAAVRNYIDEHIADSFGAASNMPIDAGYIRRNLIDDPKGYVCELSTSEGPLHQKWVRVRITPEQREQFKQWHMEATQRNRIGPLGAVLAATFLLVGLTHLLLRTRHGVTSLPLVNQQILTEPVVAKARRGWFLPTFFTICLMMVLGMTLFISILVPIRQSAIEYPPAPVIVDMESWPVVPEPIRPFDATNTPGEPPHAFPRVRVHTQSVRLSNGGRVEKLTVPVISAPHQ
jgi:hypothetical protein